MPAIVLTTSVSAWEECVITVMPFPYRQWIIKVEPKVAMQKGCSINMYLTGVVNDQTYSFFSLCFKESNRSECYHLLFFPTNEGNGTVSNRRCPIATKTRAATFFTLRGERLALSSRFIQCLKLALNIKKKIQDHFYSTNLDRLKRGAPAGQFRRGI